MSESPSLVPEDPAGSVITRERVSEVEAGDHERFAHYVRKEDILESAMTGKPVVALCGKVWVPNRDPEKFPVCPECREIFNSLPGDGSD